MTRVTVYKQMAVNNQQGGVSQRPRRARDIEPLVERNQYVGEIDAGDRSELARFFGDSIEKLARIVSLNIHDEENIKIRNGTRYVIKDSKGDVVDTKKLEDNEIQRFIEALKRALDNKKHHP